ncbi:hypothetical protein EJ06DRAFT_546539 [Trichodelitschia bisporula]|uniref:Uncharacterized protein n=1 Tax=Trichodelitschia bisporula TaxID=703511 RepID=A0A6G1I958_9PEZI|nr:hypothetical protein EJ06DRAFT_546539 [Trichodelitschia bisporula]
MCFFWERTMPRRVKGYGGSTSIPCSKSDSAPRDAVALSSYQGSRRIHVGNAAKTSPWDESCRRKRKAASATLNRAAVKSYRGMFDLESNVLISPLFNGAQASAEVGPKPYIQRYALNTFLTPCYGVPMDAINDGLLREILEVG